MLNQRIIGFTLIELVLVIALVGLLSVTAILVAPTLTPVRLDSAAKQIHSDIEYVKQYANLVSNTTGIDFVSGGDYTAYEGTIATPIKSPLDREDMIITLSDKYPLISLSSSFTVEFNRYGIPTTGGGGSVTVTDGTSTKTISVTAGTGRVTIQ
jgi:prepilin-type N-terminal cleavage/methylation domain-containing protein